MTEPMSATTFAWFVTIAVGGLGALWFIYDAINLAKSLRLDRSNPSVRDRHFGYAMGMLMATIGVVGALRFHGVL
jgi:hypothetical protein